MCDPYTGNTVADIEMRFHETRNWSFTIEDKDTITLRQSARTRYDMTENPTDPGAGTAFPESFPDLVFNRLGPSDAGLTP